MHAGAIASVADSANGYAAYTLAPPDTDVLGVEFKINLLAPAQGTGLLACGRVLRPGRTFTVCQAEVFTTGAAERALIATMLSTIMVRPRSKERHHGDTPHRHHSTSEAASRSHRVRGEQWAMTSKEGV
jgi:uncharacterized protein (TIGR00369 family)